MADIKSYSYSKKNSIVTIGVSIILGLLFLSNIFKAYHSHARIDLFIFTLLILMLSCVLGIIVFKRLLPALRGDIALEFNEKGIVDYLRNITIDWQDIQTIDFKRTRSSFMICLKLKWESDYGSQIFISLRWIGGKDSDIYDTALFYFDKFSDVEIQNEE